MSGTNNKSNTSSSTKQQTVLITGASRGIGLGLAEVYAKKGWRVVATARDPVKSNELQALVKAYSNSVFVIPLTVDDSKSVASLPASLASIGITSIDVLYNNAGIANSDPTAKGLTTIDTESVKNFLDIYRTNVIGVWEVTKVLVPFVRAAATSSGIISPRIVNISSIMGSVDATLEGPWAGLNAAYRASKAALNELSAVQAREYNVESVKAAAVAADAKTAAAPLITVISLHPGWVETDMGKGAGKPPTSIVQSVTGIEKVVSAAKTNAKAIFVDFEGNALKW